MFSEEEKATPSEDLNQVASIIMTLKQIDQRSQERLSQEEQNAAQLLLSVQSEITRMEQDDESRLNEALQREEERLEADSKKAVQAVEQSCEAARNQLLAHYEAHKAQWLKTLLSKVLLLEERNLTS